MKRSGPDTVDLQDATQGQQRTVALKLSNKQEQHGWPVRRHTGMGAVDEKERACKCELLMKRSGPARRHTGM
jgi:hypothetical protein